MKRHELDQFLRHLYQIETFDDYCYNGLQVEGAENIHKILLGVSFHSLLLEAAIREHADAIIVHHGIFGKDFFKIHEPFKKTLHTLLNKNISLFGIHLPMDAHPEIGNNAELARMIGASILEPFEVGFLVENTRNLSLQQIVNLYHKELDPDGENDATNHPSPLHYKSRGGIQYYDFGPDTPEKIGILSGGGSGYITDAQSLGADTYITGDIKEHLPAYLYDHGLNYINLGHYRSETTGVLALKRLIEKTFSVECVFRDIFNPI
ncbi:Nif3-like dinuclear metal center hexameric protein [Fidelibacter multiformis]|uniref:Nif3-like dinuclear metal center hexameric protein n=1 Tax=Fidelibacter multiformis TaxID=3377529 RepID=UPI0037DC1FEB